MKKRIVRKPSPAVEAPKKQRKKKSTNRQLLEEQLAMYTNMPNEVCLLRGWTAEQLEEEIIRIEDALGLSKQGMMSRRKGSTYERKIARKFLEHKRWGIKLVRTPMSGGFQKSQENESMRGDLNSLDKSINFRLHSECKNQKTWKLKTWFEQAEEDCPEGKIPIVIFHKAQEIIAGKRVSAAEDFVQLRLSDFLDIVDVDKVIIKKKEVK